MQRPAAGAIIKKAFLSPARENFKVMKLLATILLYIFINLAWDSTVTCQANRDSKSNKILIRATPGPRLRYCSRIVDLAEA